MAYPATLLGLLTVLLLRLTVALLLTVLLLRLLSVALLLSVGLLGLLTVTLLSVWLLGLLSVTLLSVWLLGLAVALLLSVGLLGLLTVALLPVRLLRLLTVTLLSVRLLRLLTVTLLSVGLLRLAVALLSVGLLGLTEALLSVRLLGLAAALLLTVSHAAHRAHVAHRSVAVEHGYDLVRLLLVTPELLGIAALGSAVCKLKLDLAEIRRIDVYVDRDLICVLISRGIVAFVPALGILAVDLVLVLLYLVTRAADLRDLDDIGVLCSVIALSADQKLRLRIVDVNLCIVAENACGVEVI